MGLAYAGLGKTREYKAGIRCSENPWGTRYRLPDLEETIMLRLAVLFLVIAIIAAIFGFGGIAQFSWDGARILFFVFIVLAILSFLGGMFRRPVA